MLQMEGVDADSASFDLHHEVDATFPGPILVASRNESCVGKSGNSSPVTYIHP